MGADPAKPIYLYIRGMDKKKFDFAACVDIIKSELFHSNIMEFHAMISYMQSLCTPKLEYTYVRFWIQFTEGTAFYSGA